MAAFSCQLVPDSFLVPNKLLEDNNTTSLFSPLGPGDYLREIPVPLHFHEITSSLHTTTAMMANDQLESGVVIPMSTKRKKMEDFSKVAREGKAGSKQKISNGMLKNREEKKMKAKAKNKLIPTGYIHVRARRGEATDSHSLAERVRREKISERMRVLQSIVPGCDKITGKAQILDEIINYVQSLQNQVEVLVGKLGFVSPMLNEFNTNTLLSEDNGIPIWEINEQRLKFVNQDAQFNNSSPFF